MTWQAGPWQDERQGSRFGGGRTARPAELVWGASGENGTFFWFGKNQAVLQQV